MSDLTCTACGHVEQPVGTCPACKEPVYNSREPDGPVWTCPADLKPSSLYYEITLLSDEQRTAQENSGVFSECAEGVEICFDRMPLHSACYEKGGY